LSCRFGLRSIKEIDECFGRVFKLSLLRLLICLRVSRHSRNRTCRRFWSAVTESRACGTELPLWIGNSALPPEPPFEREETIGFNHSLAPRESKAADHFALSRTPKGPENILIIVQFISLPLLGAARAFCTLPSALRPPTSVLCPAS